MWLPAASGLHPNSSATPKERKHFTPCSLSRALKAKSQRLTGHVHIHRPVTGWGLQSFWPRLGFTPILGVPSKSHSLRVRDEQFPKGNPGCSDPKEEAQMPAGAPQASPCQAAHFILPSSLLRSCPSFLVLPYFWIWGKCPRITRLPCRLHSTIFSQHAALRPPALGHAWFCHWTSDTCPPQPPWSFHHDDPPSAFSQESV